VARPAVRALDWLLGSLIGLTLLAPSAAAAMPLDRPAQPRQANDCTGIGSTEYRKLEDYTDGQTRLFCWLPIADPTRTDLRADVLVTRTGDELLATLQIDEQDAGGGTRTLWSQAETGRAAAPVQTFDQITTFLPLGEQRGQLVYVLGSCGASCGASEVAVLGVANEQVQPLLQTEAGWPASVVPVGRGFVLSARQRNSDPSVPYTQIDTLYEWTAGAYTATDTVQIDQKRPG